MADPTEGVPTEGVRGGWPVGAFAWLAAATVHASLVALYYFPAVKAPLGDESMYRRAAESVLAQGTSHLGSFWPPLYAWFLAPLLALAHGAMWPVQVAQTLLLGLSAWLLRRLVRRWLDDAWAADLAFFLTLTYPPLVAFAHYLWPEILHLCLMLAALVVLVESRGRAPAVLVGGLFLALCLQTKVVLLPLLPALAVGLVVSWPPRRRALPALCLGLAVLVGVAPTLRAQWRDFGRPMLADSGWFNIWVGLNEVSPTEFRDSVVVDEYLRYRQSALSAGGRADIARRKIFATLRQRGVWGSLRRQLPQQYLRLFNRESFLTHQLPGGAVHERGGGYRAQAGLPSRAVRWLSFAGWTVLLVGFGLGSAIFPYDRRATGWWVLGFIALQCVLFLVLHVKTRYRIQMLPGIFFFAVYAASWGRQRLQGEAPQRPRLRWALGALLSAAMLYLAFAPAWLEV